MRKIFVVLMVMSGCATFFPGRAAERDRIERCKLTLPVLRSEPAEPYRVIRLIEATDEIEMAWYACAEHADAVISSFAQDQVTSVTVGGGPHVVGGSAKTKTEGKFVGREIKYDGPTQPAHARSE